MKLHCYLCASLFFSLPVTAQSAPQVCPDGSAPYAAVMGYLTAMHEHRFSDAFDFVSDRMTDGQQRSEWSALQERAYNPGEVDIYGVDARRAMATAEDPACTDRAVVPNILSSRDKLNKHGSVEFEIYMVARKAGVWRVDSQETLFEDAAVAKWFPEVKMFRNPTPE